MPARFFCLAWVLMLPIAAFGQSKKADAKSSVELRTIAAFEKLGFVYGYMKKDEEKGEDSPKTARPRSSPQGHS